MNIVRELLRQCEVDRAVFYALTLRGWQFVAGPVTALLVATFFDTQVQGYFYTFASLLALQSFLELGFHVVIMNVASHEWARLGLDDQGRIAGDPAALSRLVSLGRLIAQWYAVVAVLFVLLAAGCGWYFFRDGPLDAVQWLPPWLILVVLTGLSLWTLPFHALLEGCNQVAQVNRFRVWQAVLGNVVVWCCIPLGAELWTCVAIAAVKLVCEALLLAYQYGPFFRVFWPAPAGPTISWRDSIWPLQWRLAVQGFFNYFAFWLFTPVMFKVSPAAGGQMGMSWTVLTAIQAAALAWVQTRAPRFGVLAATRQFDELDRLFRRLTWVSLAVVIAGGGAFWCAVWLLHVLQLPLADRVLPLQPLGLFVLAIIVFHVPHCQTFYVRAHKREMFLFIGVASSLLIGTSTVVLGFRFGAIGVAAGYLAIVAVFIVPYQYWLWQRCRAERE